MTTEQAERVAEHLRTKGLDFCYINESELITRASLTEGYGITF